MTHTRIIAADGTAYRPEGAGVRTAKRILLIIICLIGALFISAAIIGFVKAATAHPAKATQGTADYNDGWTDGLGDLLDNYNATGGKAKIANCLSITRDADTFHTCIDHP